MVQPRHQPRGKPMALSYKARRRWSLFVLLVALPVYIVFMIWGIAQFEK